MRITPTGLEMAARQWRAEKEDRWVAGRFIVYMGTGVIEAYLSDWSKSLIDSAKLTLRERGRRMEWTRAERGEVKQNIVSVLGVSVARLHFPAGFTPRSSCFRARLIELFMISRPLRARVGKARASNCKLAGCRKGYRHTRGWERERERDIEERLCTLELPFDSFDTS